MSRVHGHYRLPDVPSSVTTALAGLAWPRPGMEVAVMYGTVMVAQLKEPTTAEELRESMEKWRASRPGRPGLIDAQMLLTEDGGRVVSAVRFASKEDYWAIADDVAHDEWFATKIAPLLEGEPTWMDGNWIED